MLAKKEPEFSWRLSLVAITSEQFGLRNCGGEISLRLCSSQYGNLSKNLNAFEIT